MVDGLDAAWCGLGDRKEDAAEAVPQAFWVNHSAQLHAHLPHTIGQTG
jgi:hypothetical protein